MGIEAFHNEHPKEETEEYLRIAEELDLLYSSGSDFHGGVTKPNIELGSGINNNLNINNLSILKKL